MIIYSEILNKEFDSVDECLLAEEEHKMAQEKAKAEEAERQEALDKAYNKAIEACEEYLKLAGVDVKVKHYGLDDDDDDFEWLDRLFRIL